MRDAIVTDIGNILMRNAQANDLSAILAVLRDAAELPRARGLDMWAWVRTPAGEKLVADRIAAGGFCIGELNRQPICSVRVEWSDPEIWDEAGQDGRAGYIHSLAVIRSVAGKQIGAAMLDWTQQMITKRGRTLQRLDCMAENPRLCRYYVDLGFSDRGVKQDGNWSARRFERTIRNDARSET
jgi:ribosomal protein S18 acetylase RimI-like enzyme